MSVTSNIAMEAANFTCKFGDKNLLDYFDDVVLPAFLEKRTRVYGETSYFFSDVKVVEVQGVLCIVGRLVKDGLLLAEQRYVGGEIVQDERTMQSSPTAVFVLMLNTHRLIFGKETKHPPTLQMFESTAIRFLKDAHKEFIGRQVESAKDTGEKLTKAAATRKHPYPILQVVPLSSEGDIKSFIRRFDKLKVVQYKFTPRNDEADNAGFFFDSAQEQQESVGSKTLTITHSNSEGLHKDQVLVEVTAATAQGNQVVTLKGVDAAGDQLKGDNADFQIKKKITVPGRRISVVADYLVAGFMDWVSMKLVKLPKIDVKTQKKLDEIKANHEG
ncbi:hypothetical protein [Pseudomonas fluorescens]|uniref:hypothetical protein n=1 Tax=Pseudomonas fluorescens TaxID=294 RepID=UPI00192AAF4D|nr:hypothetical protein [Pseudomonas fluorescens]